MLSCVNATSQDRSKMNKRKREETTPAFFGGLVVVVILPALLLFTVLHTVSSDLDESFSHDLRRRMQKDLARMRGELDPVAFIQRRLNLACGLMSEGRVNSESLGRRLQILKRQGLGFVNFRFFDDRQRLISVDGESENFRAILERIYAALYQSVSQNDNSLLTRYRSMFDVFMGSVNPVVVAAERSALIKILIKGRPGFFYWNLFYSPAGDGSVTGGIAAWFLQENIPVNLAEKQLLPDFSDEKFGLVAGVIDLSNAGLSFPDNLPAAIVPGGINSLKQIVRQMQEDSSYEKLYSDRYIFTVPLSGSRVLYIFGRTLSSLSLFDLLLKLSFLVIVPYALKYCLMARAGGGDWAKILETRPGGFTFFMVLLPIAVFGMIWLSYIDLYGKNLVQHARERISRRLEALEENYAVAIEGLAEDYRRLPVVYNLKNKDFNHITQAFPTLQREERLQRIYVLNRKGRLLLSLPETNAPDGDLVARLMSAVARKLFISRFGSEQSWKDKMNDVMLESVAANFADLLGDITSELFKPFENLDQIGALNLAGRRVHVFSTFIDTDDPEEPLLMIIWQDVDAHARRYLRNQIADNISSSEARQPVRLGMVNVESGELPFPVELAKYPFVKQMIEHAWATRLLQFSVEEIAGNDHFVAVAPIAKIPGHAIVATMSAAEKRRETKKLYFVMFMAVGVCLILPFWTGRRFSR